MSDQYDFNTILDLEEENNVDNYAINAMEEIGAQDTAMGDYEVQGIEYDDIPAYSPALPSYPNAPITPVAISREELANAIGAVESGGAGYGAWNSGVTKGKDGKNYIPHSSSKHGPQDFSNLTVAQYFERSKLPATNPNRIFAAGKYQVTPVAMRHLLDKGVITMDDKLTPETQDRMFDGLLMTKRANLSSYLKGESNDSGLAGLELAMEWAGAPVPKGYKTKGGAVSNGYYGFYGNDGVNAHQMDVSAIRKAKADRVRNALINHRNALINHRNNPQSAPNQQPVTTPNGGQQSANQLKISDVDDWGRVANILGYTSVPDEITDDMKTDLYNKLTIHVYENEKKRLRGKGKERVAMERTLEAMPDGYSALGLEKPKDETKPDTVATHQEWVNERYGEDANALTLEDTIRVRAETEVTSKYKNEPKEIRNKMIEARIASLTEQLIPKEEQQTPRDSSYGKWSKGWDAGSASFWGGVQTLGDAIIGETNTDTYWDVLGETIRDMGKEYKEANEQQIKDSGYQSEYADKNLVDFITDGNLTDAWGKLYEMTAESWLGTGLGLVGGATAVATAPVSLPTATVIGGATLAGSTAMAAGDVREELGELYDEADADEIMGLSIGMGLIDAAGGALSKAGGAKFLKESLKSGVTKEVGKRSRTKIIANAIAKGARATLPEGLTEMVQEGITIGYADAKGKEYTIDEVWKRLADAGVMGGAMGGTINLATQILPKSSPTGDTNVPATDDAPPTDDTNVPPTGDTPEVMRNETGIDSINETIHVRADGAVTRGKPTYDTEMGEPLPQNEKVFEDVLLDKDGVVKSLGDKEGSLGNTEVDHIYNTAYVNVFYGDNDTSAVGTTEGVTPFSTKPENLEDGQKIVEEDGGYYIKSLDEGTPLTEKATIDELLNSGDAKRVGTGVKALLDETGINFTVDDNGTISLTDIGDVTIRIGESDADILINPDSPMKGLGDTIRVTHPTSVRREIEKPKAEPKEEPRPSFFNTFEPEVVDAPTPVKVNLGYSKNKQGVTSTDFTRTGVEEALRDGWVMTTSNGGMSYQDPDGNIVHLAINKGGELKEADLDKENFLGKKIRLSKDGVDHDLSITNKKKGMDTNIKVKVVRPSIGVEQLTVDNANTTYADDSNITINRDRSYSFTPETKKIIVEKAGDEYKIVGNSLPDGHTYDPDTGTYAVNKMTFTIEDDELVITKEDESPKRLKVSGDKTFVSLSAKPVSVFTLGDVLRRGGKIVSSTKKGVKVSFGDGVYVFKNNGAVTNAKTKESIDPNTPLNAVSNIENVTDDNIEKEIESAQALFNDSEINDKGEVGDDSVAYRGTDADLVVDNAQDVEGAASTAISAMIGTMRHITPTPVSDQVAGERYIASDRQRKILQDVVNHFPDQIRRIISLEFDNYNNFAAANGAYGVFLPHGYGRGPRIIIDATDQHMQSMQHIIETISEEVGHFSFDSIRTPYLDNVFDTIWRELGDAILNAPELAPYVRRYGGDIKIVGWEDRISLINEYFSKRNISAVGYHDWSKNIGGVDVTSLVNELKVNEAKYIDMNEFGSGGFTDTADVVDQIYRPLITAQYKFATSSEGAEMRLGVENGKTVVHIKNRKHGTTIDERPNTLEAAEYKRREDNLRKYSIREGSWLDAVSVTNPKEFFNFLKWQVASWVNPPMGREIAYQISGAERQNSQLARTTFNSIDRQMLKVASVLAEKGYTKGVPLTKSYVDAFNEWGVEPTEANMRLAREADEFRTQAVAQKYDRVAVIRQLLEDVYQTIANDPNKTTAELAVLRKLITQNQRRFVGDWSHRRYDVRTPDGQKRLRKMIDMFDRLPNLDGKDTSVQKLEAQVTEFRELANSIDVGNRTTFLDNLDKLEQDITDIRKTQRKGGLSYETAQDRVLEKIYDFSLSNRQFKEVASKLREVDETITLQRRLYALAEANRIEMHAEGKKYRGGFNAELARRVKRELDGYLTNNKRGSRRKGGRSGTVEGTDSVYGRTLDPNNHVDQLRMEFMGQINDPMESLAHDLAQQSSLISALGHANDLAKLLVNNGMAKWNVNPDRTMTLLADEQRGSLLQFAEFENPETLRNLQDMIDTTRLVQKNILGNIVATTKYSLTIGNIANGILNYTSGLTRPIMDGSVIDVLYSAATGKDNLLAGSIKGAYNVVRNQAGGKLDPANDYEAIVIEMVENNIIGNGVDNLLLDWGKGNYLEQFTKTLARLSSGDEYKSATREQRVANAMEMIKSIYGAGDEMGKVLPYLMYRNTGLAKADLEIDPADYDMDSPRGRLIYERDKQDMAMRYATDMTNRSTISYALTPQPVKRITNSEGAPMLLGDFVIHPSVWSRIVLDQINMIVEERSELSRLRKEGKTDSEYYKRLQFRNINRMIGYGAFSTSAITFGAGVSSTLMGEVLNLATRAFLDAEETDDDEKKRGFTHSQWVAMNNVAAYLTPEGMPYEMPLPWTKGDKWVSTNFNRADITQSIMVRMNQIPGTPTEKQIQHIASEVLGSFLNLSSDSLASQLVNIARGKDRFGNNLPTAVDNLSEGAALMLPATAIDLGELATGRETYGKANDRTYKVTRMLTGFNFKDKSFSGVTSNLGKQYNRSLSLTRDNNYVSALWFALDNPNGVSDSELAEKANKIVKDRTKVYNEVSYVIGELRKTGRVSEENLKKWLKRGRDASRGITDDAVDALVNGKDIGRDKLRASINRRLKDYKDGNKRKDFTKEQIEVIIDNHERLLKSL